MQSKLIAMIGIARSGKDTFCNKWIKQPDEENYIRLVISGDKVRLGLHGMRYIHKAEPMVHGIYQTMIQSLLIHDDYKIMLNDTHTTIASIRNVLNMDINAEFIYIPCDLAVAKQRAIDTNQSDLLPVIDRMYQNLIKLSNYGNHPQLCSNDPFKENIQKSIEVIRNEVKKVKEYSDRSV